MLYHHWQRNCDGTADPDAVASMKLWPVSETTVPTESEQVGVALRSTGWRCAEQATERESEQSAYGFKRWVGLSCA